MCYICAMNVQNNRSYAKESTKSTPSGIRFDLEQLGFIQNKEPKLTTKQKVVDFLLNKFWWENKVAKPTHRGLPPNKIPYTSATPDAFDGKKMDKVTYDEPGQWQEPKSITTGLSPKISDFDNMTDELNACSTIPQIESVMKKVKSSLLTPKERLLLESHAKEISKEMFND
jgi:hypothetical protein